MGVDVGYPVPVTRTGEMFRWMTRVAIAAMLALLALLPLVPAWDETGFGAALVMANDCETPFEVATDLANPGTRSQSGEIAVTRGSGLVGEFGGTGRFANYGIVGLMEIIQNTASGMARVQGEFTATSPDGGSSITLSFTGQVDFGAARAMGNFVVVDATGADAGYRASGTIEGTVVAPGTLRGMDVGLC